MTAAILNKMWALTPKKKLKQYPYVSNNTLQCHITL